MKKENYNYFDEFIAITDCIVKSAEILQETILNFNSEELEAKTNKVHELENDADNIVHKLRNYLITDFLPPLEREDLATIAHRLDDIEDDIDELLINMKILNISEMRSDVKKFTEKLISCTNCVKEVFINFKNLKKKELIKEKIIAVNNLEEEGDRIFEEAIFNLYKNEKNAINIIKWSNIYNCLENALDDCERLSDCVEDVILKNS